MRYRLSDGASAEGRTFWGVADTGSAFLLVGRCLRRDCPDYCSKWGCFEGEGRPAALEDTVEVYVSGESEVQWRRGVAVTFPDSTQAQEEAEAVAAADLVFGVQGRIRGKGGTGAGAFFGLVRDRSEDIRPSFLEQTAFTSFAMDFREVGSESISFAPSSLLGRGRGRGLGGEEEEEEALPLVDPRQWGDPIRHYAAIAAEVRVAGTELLESDDEGAPGGGGGRPRRVLCIFDSGTTGVTMTRGLYDSYLRRVLDGASSGLAFSEAKRLEVVFRLASGRSLVLDAFSGRHPSYGLGLDIVTPVEEISWAGGAGGAVAPWGGAAGAAAPPLLRPFEDVAFLGLGFFMGRRLTVDALAGRLAVSPRRGAGAGAAA